MARILIKNGRIWDGEKFSYGDIFTSGSGIEKIAESLEKRGLLLKLLAVNLYDMEENSRMERLVCFKTAYGKYINPFYRHARS